MFHLISVVEEDDVGGRQSLASCALMLNHSVDRGQVPAIADLNSSYLCLMSAIHNHHVIQLRPPARRFDQKRHVEHQTRRMATVGLEADLCSDQWVQDGFQLRFGLRVRKHVFAHVSPMERAIGIYKVRSECLCDGSHGAASSCGAGARNGIGVNDFGTTGFKEPGHRTLAAANAPCQAQSMNSWHAPWP